MNTNSTTTLGSTRCVARARTSACARRLPRSWRVAGATALVRTRADSPARPDAAVVVDSTIDPHDDPLVARFGQAPSDPANDPLVIRYGRPDATNAEDPLVIRFGSN